MNNLPTFDLGPQIKLPPSPVLPPRMKLEVPRLQVPSYKPLVMPSQAQMKRMMKDEAEKQDRQKQKKSKQSAQPPQPLAPPKPEVVIAPINEVTQISVPGTEIKIPVPRAEIVSTAVMTAGASSVAAVAGTLAASRIFNYSQKILKPVITKVLRSLAKLLGKSPPESDARKRWRRRARRLQKGRSQV